MVIGQAHGAHQDGREWDSLILVSDKARHNIVGRRTCSCAVWFFVQMDRQWQVFKEQIGELQKLFIPIWCKSGWGTEVKVWLSREIRDSIRFKEEAYKLVRKSNRPEDWEQFKIQ